MKRTIYLDYAATTPVDSRVRRASEPYQSEIFGNPGSLHSFGQFASAAVFEARRELAKAIGAGYQEIIFTGSATEANNLALRGVVQAARSAGIQKPRIVISTIEHDSVFETARDLELTGVDVVYIPVSKEGIIDSSKLEAILNGQTVLVSLMYANNEIGSIQSIAKIGEIIRVFRERKVSKENIVIPKGEASLFPLFHTDAVQAFGFLPTNVETLNVDLMTLSAHKIYGPKGIGALYLRGSRVQGIGYRVGQKDSLNPNRYTLNPMVTGGGQEFGLRSGTENVSAIVGFGKAVELVTQLRERDGKRLEKLSHHFFRGLKKIFSQASLNGPRFSKERLPNNINVYLPGIRRDVFLISLDRAGILASAGSACGARSTAPSRVLGALQLPRERERESVRFTLGRPTKKIEIDTALRIIKNLK